MTQQSGATRLRTLDGYLAVLDGEIAGLPSRRARMLAEVRAHLDDAVAELTSQGHDRAAAEREAIRRFGDPVTLAHKMRSTLTLAYEEAVRSVSLGLLVLYVTWVGLALVTPVLEGFLPLVVASVSYPLGLGLRLWERRQHLRGEHVPRPVTAANGTTAGQGMRVVAGLGAIGVALVPVAAYSAPLGWTFAAALAAVAVAWAVLSGRAPTKRGVTTRRRVAGVLASLAVIPLGLYAMVLAVVAWPSYDPSGDARLTACAAEGGTIRATVRITNHDDVTHGYLVIPEVVHRDRVIANLTSEPGYGSVAPGETVTRQFSGKPTHPSSGEPQPLPGEPQPVPDHFTCKIGSVETAKEATSFFP